MKNKKLFAILTLVCFMFTLMPVAAFAAGEYYYAELTGNTAVEQGDSLNVSIDTNDANATFYVFAYNDGVYSRAFGLNALATTATQYGFTATVAVPQSAPAGEYTLYVVDANRDAQNIYNDSTMLNKDKAAKMLADATRVSMIKNSFSVTGLTSNYSVTIAPAANFGQAVSADAGYSSTKAVVTVTNTTTQRPVVGEAVEVYTDSYGLQVTNLTGKTNARGQIEILITGTVPGNFNVYADYEGETSAAYPITVGSVGVDNVTVAAAPKAPINKIGAKAATSGIEFLLTDAHGTKVNPATVSHKVTLISAPAGVSKEVALKLVDNANDNKEAYIVKADGSDYALTVKGEYTFKVALQNGASATASVTVADFDKTVAIQFVNAPTTVAYNAQNAAVVGKYIVAVDANGVTKVLYGPNDNIAKNAALSLSVNGKAVQNFDGSNSLTMQSEDDFIGTTVTVLAVYTEGTKTFTATNEMAVVDNAATVVYTSTTAEVGVNNTLYARLVDASGKAVSLATGAPQVIVLDKPANAVVNVVESWDAVKRMVKVEFLASAAGEYKLQTIVTYNNGQNYISGIETITVGGAQGTFKDVVVMSIGAANIVVNSDVKAIPAAPMIQDGRTFVPFRALAEAFGAVVAWDEATQSVTAELNGVKVVMVIGANDYTVNGVAKTADVAPFINGGSTMVPVRFVAEAFGINVTPIAAADGSVADVLFAK